MLIFFCPCFFVHLIILAFIPLDTAAVFYVNRNGKPCFERRLKNCCTGWTDDYREGIVAVEVVEETFFFAKKYKLVVKSSDGWPPYRVNKFPIMKRLT